MANQCSGKAAPEIPALKPYRGKPAVRNFREGDGNVGIIRSPLRAIVLPDRRRARTASGGLSVLSGHPASRCAWPESDSLLRAYHDEEWACPNTTAARFGRR